MSMPPTIRIDLGSTVPAYRQIADAIRARLVGGDFRPGDQLPTVRQIAIDLGVHHNTVAEAYRTLAEEGWLDLGRRRGATVQERSAPKATPKTKARFRQRLRELVAEALGAGVSADIIAAELTALAGITTGNGGHR
jgi:DNA-binding transcriptional regulator YhcF (GntR family)